MEGWRDGGREGGREGGRKRGREGERGGERETPEGHVELNSNTLTGTNTAGESMRMRGNTAELGRIVRSSDQCSKTIPCCI